MLGFVLLCCLVEKVTAVKSTTASPPTVANNKTITTTILPQTTTKTTTSWVNSSRVLTSQEITKQNNTTPFSFTKEPSTGRSRETSGPDPGNSGIQVQIKGNKSMTATGRNTTGEARGIVRETRNQPEATRNVVNVIIGLMISLIVIGGVAGGAVFYWFRKRHKNDRSQSDQDSLAATYSTVEKAITPDMEPTRDDQNAYEEIKDRKNPLYAGGDGFNTYEEVKARENPSYNGSDDHNTVTIKESNNPTYESMDDALKRTIEAGIS